jgi:soluble cytochrome b562
MSNLRHKTPDELRKEISYQERMLAFHDVSIAKMEKLLAEGEAYVEATKASLSKQRMTRNNHYQRYAWAKNYLVMKEG